MEIIVPAFEVQQSKNRKLYSFAIDGKRIPEFAGVTRVKRGVTAELIGYQRPEVLNHIAEIRKYLESQDPMLPNAIVVAFNSGVKFRCQDDGNGSGVRSGALHIPVQGPDSKTGKVGWIVDGQQRLAAIGQADVDSFPVVVNAFVAEDIEEQRSQFILVNSTKPLPQGLIYELLPLTQGVLPTKWAGKQKAAEVMQWLNFNEDSPFRGLIKSPTNPNGVVQDNSVLRMINMSYKDGALYESGDDDATTQSLLTEFWGAVKAEFANAWGKSPRYSRLMHGVGIISMGCLMDSIVSRNRNLGKPSEEMFRNELQLISPKCQWTSGSWDFGSGVTRKWNELQNTSKDIQLITNFLVKEYRLAKSL